LKRNLPTAIILKSDLELTGSAVVSRHFFPKEEFEDLNNIEFHLEKNGETVQKGVSSDMIFNIDKIISHVSRYMMLKIGDLIYTGTPAGVGKVQDGDVLEGYLKDSKMFKVKIK